MPILPGLAAARADMSAQAMKILVTGANGFVGPHLLDALRREFRSGFELLATGKPGSEGEDGIAALDITDPNAVSKAISDFLPTHFFHLAGIAAPTAAGADPDGAWSVNVGGTLNVARAILAHAPDCTLFSVGSGLVYGQSANSGVRLDENALLAPLDDYGVTKAAGDLALGAFARKGLKCVRFRPFNHTGPGQTDDFVVPAFAMQIARIEAGLQPPRILVGNLEAKRDFLDVRDVARAYALAAARAPDLKPGCILNVASGTARRIGDILDMLLSLSTSEIEIAEDAARMRPSDIPSYSGDARLARQVLDWQPEYDFEATIADVLNDCRKRAGIGSAGG